VLRQRLPEILIASGIKPDAAYFDGDAELRCRDTVSALRVPLVAYGSRQSLRSVNGVLNHESGQSRTIVICIRSLAIESGQLAHVRGLGDFCNPSRPEFIRDIANVGEWLYTTALLLEDGTGTWSWSGTVGLIERGPDLAGPDLPGPSSHSPMTAT
jgi:hypothetical protein